MDYTKTHLSNFFIWIGNQPGREKITFGGFQNVHYTLIFKKDQRVVDLHKSTVSNGVKSYEQIFEMRIFTMLRLLITINQINEFLIHNFFCFTQRINLGKLKKHKLILMSPTYDEKQSNLVLDNRRKKKIRIKEEIPTEIIQELLFYPNEMDWNTHKMSFVYSNKKRELRQEGFIFRLDNDKRTKSFYFMTSKNFRKYLRSTNFIILNVLNTVEFKNKENVLGFLQEVINKK